MTQGSQSTGRRVTCAGCRLRACTCGEQRWVDCCCNRIEPGSRCAACSQGDHADCVSPEPAGPGVMATPEPGGVVDKHACLDPQHPDCVVVLRSAWQVLGDSFVKERDDAATLRRELAEARAELELHRDHGDVVTGALNRAEDRAQASERALGETWRLVSEAVDHRERGYYAESDLKLQAALLAARLRGGGV